MECHSSAERDGRKRWAALAVGAVGVVYGDIGTSPLYALRECFNGPEAIPVTLTNLLGTLSLVFWSLILIVSIKYLTLVMRVDNRGEGGILALLAIVVGAQPRQRTTRRAALIVGMGLFGAALLYGDGMITPAISVLSAIEGLDVVTPVFRPFVIPLTIAVLVALFSLQSHGSGRVGKVFGPVMLVWFAAIGLLGLEEIRRDPGVLWALNPLWAIQFFMWNRWGGFIVLGSVFLVLTGSEALYADLGHFGRGPIRLAWSTVVLPALLLNYFGQGALLLRNPAAAANPFYHLCPRLAVVPMVFLATLATVIASQALISGAFSLTLQAIQLGYCPRMRIEHTSSAERGQIYIPEVNWALMVACVCLVLGFESSSNLAAAYGMAVTLTMLTTTFLFYLAARRLWHWDPRMLALLCGLFFVVELAYFGANLLKVEHGGWFPLLAGLGIFTLMTTWKTGREILGQRLRQASLPLEAFLHDVAQRPPVRVPGTAVFLSGRRNGTPLALLHNIKHNKVLHQRVIILTVWTEDIPHIPVNRRIELEELGNGFFRMVGRFGFMDEPNVPRALAELDARQLKLRPEEVTYFLSRETILAARRPGMALWREKLFAVLARNAQSAASFFRLPANRVVELGMHIEI
jgi:KUP system potassium uptake protein